MDVRKTSAKSPEAWLATVPEATRDLCAELRDLMLEWVPDLSEAIKWNMLALMGEKQVVLLGGFKRHVTLFFNRGAELDDPSGIFLAGDGVQMRSIQVKSMDDVNRPALRSLLRAAVALDAAGPPPPAPKTKRPPAEPPPELAAALKKNKAAAAGYAKLSPSCQREWISWITQAKREETKARRLEQTVAALALGRKWAERAG